MRFLRVSILFVLSVLLFTASSEANMKKGKVGAGGEKGFFFSTNSDGPCSSVLVYDSVTSDIDVLVGDAEAGDLLAAGFSQQNNYDIAEVSLPPGDYLVVVQSFRGGSPFRLVVNCGNQETISNLGTGNKGIELKEVELDAKGRKLLQTGRSIAERLKRP